jgi:phosphohistidine phosphatase SixA
MKVVLLRHAARPAHDPGDCSLTTYGLAQAEALARAIVPQGDLPMPTRLLASPKKRAQQTLVPLSQFTQVGLETDPRLDERRQNETQKEFDQRITVLIKDFSQPQPRPDSCVYLCSHFDWLQTASLLLPSDASPVDLERNWANCEYLVFRIANSLWELVRSGIVAPR